MNVKPNPSHLRALKLVAKELGKNPSPVEIRKLAKSMIAVGETLLNHRHRPKQCPEGHALTKDNTYHHPHGGARCKACHRIRLCGVMRAKRAREKAARA